MFTSQSQNVSSLLALSVSAFSSHWTVQGELHLQRKHRGLLHPFSGFSLLPDWAKLSVVSSSRI